MLWHLAGQLLTIFATVFVRVIRVASRRSSCRVTISVKVYHFMKIAGLLPENPENDEILNEQVCVKRWYAVGFRL